MSEKKASTIQCNYRKCGTHAQVFSQTLTHGNSKNENYRKCGTHAQVFSQTLTHGNSKNEIDKETEEGKREA